MDKSTEKTFFQELLEKANVKEEDSRLVTYLRNRIIDSREVRDRSIEVYDDEVFEYLLANEKNRLLEQDNIIKTLGFPTTTTISISYKQDIRTYEVIISW